MNFDGSFATFEFSHKDDLSYETYIGVFRTKCFLTPIDIIKADKTYRELIGEISPLLASNSAQTMAFCISQLSARVTEAPDFFRIRSGLPGGHLPEGVLTAILEKCIEAEELYRKQQRDKFNEIQKKLQVKFEEGKIKKNEEDQSSEEEENYEG